MSIERTSVEMLLQPFFRKMQIRDKLGIEEQQALAAAADQRLDFTQGQDLVKEGDRPTRSMLVTNGFTCRYGVAPGGDRQITAIHLPGDFVDLHSFLLKEMDHSVGALTDCKVITFPHENLVRVTERFPHLTRLLWLMTLLDGAIHREWLLGMGRLSAPQRTAHRICETYTRLNALGLAENHRFVFPITQAALADAVGITPVHVNRVLQDLRQRGLIGWDKGMMEIRDWNTLAREAQFDNLYLHLVEEPR
ncbi:Crp/Fnr family transcriptional regulator [Devosia oryziradicis]|uniref:Crp/Fnr family transcriptional regulator n=1 Tax=Devosia oryziradicis TaxID=2801335 RepID=A0ABX7C4F2_9HYPH|nr:Crp/Fnr family transcriptional regulator [Devosia oryziradicis]QQR37632.1 Crp/Fnr family transcriptional regulator [Devosia oryziradicis]